MVSLSIEKVDNSVPSSGPLLEYSGTVWAFAPLSGLLLLHPDGSICNIHDLHALSLFGYNKDELLRKVSQLDPQNKLSASDNLVSAHFCHCCFVARALPFWCLAFINA